MSEIDPQDLTEIEQDLSRAVGGDTGPSVSSTSYLTARETKNYTCCGRISSRLGALLGSPWVAHM